MFNIAKRDIDPITQLLQQLDPDADHGQMKDWGILFLCCGGLAGQSEKNLLPTNLPILTPQNIDEKYAAKFANYIG